MSVFLGASDKGDEGTWSNTDGTEFIGFWIPGEPNNSGGEEHCLSTSHVRLLNDSPCDKQKHFGAEY